MNSHLSLATLFQRPTPRDKVVAFGPDGTCSHADWVGQVARIAAQLRQQPELKRLCLVIEDSYLFAAAFFAALHEQREIILLPGYQPKLLQQFSSCFDLIVSDQNLESVAALLDQPRLNICADIPPMDHTAPAASAIKLGPIELSSQLSLYTSGSTGTPKQVRKQLAQLDAEIAALEQLWGQGMAGHAVIATVPHQHIYGLLFRILWPLAAGRPFARHTIKYQEQLCDLKLPVAHTVLISSPAFLKRLDSQLLPGKAISTLFSSGGPLPLQAASQAEALFNQLPFEVLGSTETGGIGWRQQSDSNPGGWWQPLPGVSLSLGEAAEGLPEQERDNRLKVHSPFTTEAYAQTCDCAEFSSNGRFRILGRADRIVKIEEKRVSLPQIEALAQTSPWIQEAVALTLTTGSRLEVALVAELTDTGARSLKENGKAFLNRALRSFLNEHIERVVLPRRFRFVDRLPVNAQGKIPHANLLALFQEVTQ